jgi:hypothetical protein
MRDSKCGWALGLWQLTVCCKRCKLLTRPLRPPVGWRYRPSSSRRIASRSCTVAAHSWTIATSSCSLPLAVLGNARLRSISARSRSTCASCRKCTDRGTSKATPTHPGEILASDRNHGSLLPRCEIAGSPRRERGQMFAVLVRARAGRPHRCTSHTGRERSFMTSWESPACAAHSFTDASRAHAVPRVGQAGECPQ